MIEQDFIMVIMNCKAYKTKAEYQKKTWLKYIPEYIKYYHVIGIEDLENEYNFVHDENILYVKNKDDYNSLPHKVIMSYKAIFDNFKFKYLFKTDDDQILVNNNLFNILSNLLFTKTPKIHYGGFIVNVDRPYVSQYHKLHPELPVNLIINKTKYCSGRFYLLSCESIKYLIYKKDSIVKEYLEDYAIGYYLHEYFKQNIFHISTNQFFTDIEKSDFHKDNV